MLPNDEKRHFIRMSAHCAMTFCTLDSNQERQATCVNLSATGLSFTTGRPVAAGQGLDVGIQPKNNLTPPLRALAEVIRCTPCDAGFEVAASIKAIKGE
jgi:hypothetical protein